MGALIMWCIIGIVIGVVKSLFDKSHSGTTYYYGFSIGRAMGMAFLGLMAGLVVSFISYFIAFCSLPSENVIVREENKVVFTSYEDGITSGGLFILGCGSTETSLFYKFNVPDPKIPNAVSPQVLTVQRNEDGKTYSVIVTKDLDSNSTNGYYADLYVQAYYLVTDEVARKFKFWMYDDPKGMNGQKSGLLERWGYIIHIPFGGETREVR